MPLPELGPPRSQKRKCHNIEPTTATIHAVVNPEGYDTHYHFEYVDQGSYEHEGGFSSSHTRSTNSTDLGLIIENDAVLAPLSPLQPETTYHYRVVAESECEPSNPGHICVNAGPDETFESLPAVSVHNFTTQTVGPEEVKLKAELNPNGLSSNYTVRYGKTNSYSDGSTEGTLSVGNEFVKVEAAFPGLSPNTEYHYQLIAHNDNGEIKTADQTFTTEHSPTEERQGEECPNTNLREENNSLSLPDCRAYEKTTVTHKEGGEAFNSISLSPNGERVLYFSEGVFGGATDNELAIPYLAQRTAGGWITRAVVSRPGSPPAEPLLQPGLFSPEMDRWLFMEATGLNLEQAVERQEAGYFSMGFAAGNDILHATPTIKPIEGGSRFLFNFMSVSGVSEDLSHIFISTGARLLPGSEDPRPDDDSETSVHPGGTGIPPEADRIYEISGAGGSDPAIRLAAEIPLHLEGGGCFIDPSNTIGRKLGEKPRFTSEDGSTLIYTAPIEHEAGANCGSNAPNPYGLFTSFEKGAPVQLNAPPPSQCSSPSPCSSADTATPLYDGASPDGSHVWFTTTQPLINSDKDSTNDLYMAKLENGQLVELVQASAGEATSTHPNPGEGADVGETGITDEGGVNQGVVRISADGSHAAFESPAVLTDKSNALGQSAARHANNLYVYDAATNETKFVTELCSGPELSGTEKFTTPAPHFVTSENAVADPACPASLSGFISSNEANNGSDDALWLPGAGGEATFTPDGNYLLFASYGRLASGDTDSAQDIYRYDFQTGQLIRVSIGRDGNDANGNDDAFPDEFTGTSGGIGDADSLAEDSARSISADGSTVIFRTPAPLVSHDTDEGAHPDCHEFEPNVAGTGCDIYEWEEDGHSTCSEAGGCVSLVSSGLNSQGVQTAVISSSGRDIAFQTSRNLVPEDTDGIGDIYDARVDGGFHASHPPAGCGSPEICRPLPGAQSTPPPSAPNHSLAPVIPRSISTAPRASAASSVTVSRAASRYTTRRRTTCAMNATRERNTNTEPSNTGKARCTLEAALYRRWR